MTAEAAPPLAARAFSPRVVIALLLVGVFSFSAFMTLTAFAPELSRGDDGRAHALSRSAVGYAGALRLARARGDVVNVSRNRSVASAGAALTVFTPERPISPEDVYQRAHGNVLIVLPKWFGAPHPTHRGWVAHAEPAPEPWVGAIVDEIVPEAEIARVKGAWRPDLHFQDFVETPTTMRAGEIDGLQTISAANLIPIVSDSRGYAVLAQVADWESVYILADPDFLNTRGIANLDTARAGLAMLDLLHPPDTPIAFDATLNGFERSRSLLRLAFEPPFLAATLSLAAAAALLGWRAATISGPKRREQRAIALGKRALAENSAALIRMAGRAHRMGVGYARLTSAQAAELIGAARANDAETIAQLDRLGAGLGLSRAYSDLVAEASAAKTTHEVLAAARGLHQWKEEMRRATR